jgi:hypothetical protein
VYSNSERGILRSADFSVVDDPDAFGFINEKGLVFLRGTYAKLAWYTQELVWRAAIIREQIWAELDPFDDLNMYASLECHM